MTEELYSPYKLAKELGFSEELARHYEKRGTDATKLRQIARAMNLPSSKPTLSKPNAKSKPSTQQLDGTQGKLHRHYYRKNGVCSCGVAKKVKS